MLLRLPYDPINKPVEEFRYEEFFIKRSPQTPDGVFVEDVDSKDATKYLWGNAAFALAERITNAFANYHWCAAIRGVEGGGKVADLPFHTFKTADGDVALKCPTETAITDGREKELSDLGFISLVHCKGEPYAAFFGGQTTNKPLQYLTDSATANARISSALPYILASSRFAHYLKVIMRDKIGSFMTRDNVATFLNTWISQYVLLDDDAPQSVKARFPLREARVDVTDQPGKPGCYSAVVFLKPHFQLDELSISIRLVAELPPAAK
jgi:type VI secretion system protein ImpC